MILNFRHRSPYLSNNEPPHSPPTSHYRDSTWHLLDCQQFQTGCTWAGKMDEKYMIIVWSELNRPIDNFISILYSKCVFVCNWILPCTPKCNIHSRRCFPCAFPILLQHRSRPFLGSPTTVKINISHYLWLPFFSLSIVLVKVIQKLTKNKRKEKETSVTHPIVAVFSLDVRFVWPI